MVMFCILYTVLSLVASLSMCQASFDSVLCFQVYALDKIINAKNWKGINSVTTCDWTMVLAL